MPLTPEDVRNKQFTTVRLREGYDEDEVDAFLDEVEGELTRLLRENEDLRAKLAAATRAAAQNQQNMRKEQDQHQRPGLPVPAAISSPAEGARSRACRSRCSRSSTRQQQQMGHPGPPQLPSGQPQLPGAPAAPGRPGTMGMDSSPSGGQLQPASAARPDAAAGPDAAGPGPMQQGPGQMQPAQMQQPGQMQPQHMGGLQQMQQQPHFPQQQQQSSRQRQRRPRSWRSPSRRPTRRSPRRGPRPTRSSVRRAAVPRVWSGTPVPRPTPWSGTRRRSTASRWAPRWSPPARHAGAQGRGPARLRARVPDAPEVLPGDPAASAGVAGGRLARPARASPPPPRCPPSSMSRALALAALDDPGRRLLDGRPGGDGSRPSAASRASAATAAASPRWVVRPSAVSQSFGGNSFNAGGAQQHQSVGGHGSRWLPPWTQPMAAVPSAAAAAAGPASRCAAS